MGTTIGVIKGDTRSLDSSSYNPYRILSRNPMDRLWEAAFLSAVFWRSMGRRRV